MLPERAFREFLIDAEWRGYPATTGARFWLLLFLSHTKSQNAKVNPQTLTGQAWYDAMDRELDAALGVIY